MLSLSKWFASPGKLRELGIMGINQRNSRYVMRYNKRQLYPLVDDKLKTKQLAVANNLAVPELYGVARTEKEVQTVEQLIQGHSQFVIKPAQGSGGNGILVIDGRIGKNYRRSSGRVTSLGEIQHHCSNILSGMYSLAGQPDAIMVEYMVQFDPLFQHISYQGVPDIRVIVFRGIPVASMVRLPTRESDGKANLHQGAIGVGININSGTTMIGVHHNHTITEHPDTGHSAVGMTIPNWDDILKLSIQCADTVKLGYLGVDLVIDSQKGPLMLELNARPGLNVQLANRQGLLKKLEALEAYQQLPTNVDERAALAKKLSIII